MNETKTQQGFTEDQYKYLRYVARGRKDIAGNSYTEEQFAKAIGVDRTTTYRWRGIPGFAQVLFEEILKENMHYLPQLVQAQVAAAGKKGKGGETAAMTLLLRQYQLLQSDKIDHTTNGKDMPAPIMKLPE